MKILLVEDDKFVAELLASALSNQHYLVDLATDGQAGWELAEAFEYDLILLDLMLPKLDGISFCQKRRQQGDRTPILLLTGHETSNNKVMGLDAGADDYVVKPFDLHELLARIRALLRRGSLTTTPVMEWENLRFDPNNCEVTYNGQFLHLTPKEYALLELFLRNTQRIFSQSALLDHLWSFEEPPSENTVRAHIKSLRQKLKKAGAATDFIETVYGLGYRLKLKEAATHHRQTETPKTSPPTPQSTSVVQQSESEIPPEITALWERFQEKYSDRLTVIEQAVTALLDGRLSEDLRQQAVREAHTLVGSLGSFGLIEASRLSREIEQTFQASTRLSPTQENELSSLVKALRQSLKQSPTPVNLPTPQPPTVKLQHQLLIVDDDTVLALAIVSQATTWGVQAQVASDLSHARIAIARTRPDVVLLDLCFPDSKDGGFDLLREIASTQPPIPVLVFTAQESFADRVKVARLGGQGFLQKPVSPTQVMEAIAQVLHQSDTPQANVLIVDDDPQLLDFLRTLLEPWGFKLTLLNDPQQFWNTLEQTTPDLIILDVEMPELSGIELCQVVRHDPRWSELPVLFLSARTDIETVHRVFTAGADDYVSKPIVGPELVARMLNRLERVQILRKLRKLMS
ncbi:MAG: response regulator [Cyanobacteriota bacterium]|nr:response regulator [Cyanobacteriota bacterium]